jgi:hypothetical protein
MMEMIFFICFTPPLSKDQEFFYSLSASNTNETRHRGQDRENIFWLHSNMIPFIELAMKKQRPELPTAVLSKNAARAFLLYNAAFSPFYLCFLNFSASSISSPA